MDEFEDDAEIDVVVIQFSGGSAGQDGEGGANALAVGFANILHVGFHTGVEFANLFADAGLDLCDMRTNEVEREQFRIDGFASGDHRHF